MSMPLEETYVSVDADLDTASDNRKHAHCTFCQKFDGPVLALCGEMKVAGPAKNQNPQIPPNACKRCVELFYKPCVLCGRGAF